MFRQVVACAPRPTSTQCAPCSPPNGYSPTVRPRLWLSQTCGQDSSYLLDAASALDELLAGKAAHNEDFSTPRFPDLDRYLTSKLISLNEMRNALPAFEPDRKLVNAFFREVVANAA